MLILQHQDVFNYARGNVHRFKLIYVSIDTDLDAFRRAISQKPFLTAMEFNDGSNLPTPSHDDGLVPPLARSEHYLLADDPDLEPSSDASSPPVYARPYSRAHLASKWGILQVPTLVIYDLRSGKVLNWNVRPPLVKQNRVHKTWDQWLAGESGDLSLQGGSMGFQSNST
jgi:hypothetical protein